MIIFLSVNVQNTPARVTSGRDGLSWVIVLKGVVHCDGESGTAGTNGCRSLHISSLEAERTREQGVGPGPKVSKLNLSGIVPPSKLFLLMNPYSSQCLWRCGQLALLPQTPSGSPWPRISNMQNWEISFHSFISYPGCVILLQHYKYKPLCRA